MNFRLGVVALSVAFPSLTWAFTAPSTSTFQSTSTWFNSQNNVDTDPVASSNDKVFGATRLNMAFDNKGEESNIFDGPMALTKERDACGVGFIANTKDGKFVACNMNRYLRCRHSDH